MKRSKQTVHTEPFVRKLYAQLVEDLKPSFTEKSWFSPRNYAGPQYKYWEPYDFKRMYQLENFSKRILYTTDPSFEQLSQESYLGFADSQRGFGLPPTSTRSSMVIERARSIVTDILGTFDFTKFFGYCAFGKRAAYNLKYRESYLDVRVTTLNGTPAQKEWFKAALCYDLQLHRVCRRGLKKYRVTDVLDVQAVPKSFKAARIMAPDTTVGGFLSRGLGSYVRAQLEANTHIDLKTQQQLHKEQALLASSDGYRCTIDMKKASDSYVWDHIVALVPEDWQGAIDVCRTPKAKVPGVGTIDLRSVMLMGSGHTFPLQTLLFYSICKAVLELMGSSAKVDVYGDDIMFPAEYSHYVIASLHDLGFSVNVEKSFIDGPFKESCGGDYHTGVDVRPFMPEHECGLVDRYHYAELLHKLANGLLRRWDYCEVERSYDLILIELLRLWPSICVVPPNETETAGIYYLPEKFRPVADTPTVTHGVLTYRKLVRVPKKRVPRGRAHLWYWFFCTENRPSFLANYRRWKIGLFTLNNEVTNDPYEDRSDGLLDAKGREAKKGSYRLRWVV